MVELNGRALQPPDTAPKKYETHILPRYSLASSSKNGAEASLRRDSLPIMVWLVGVVAGTRIFSTYERMMASYRAAYVPVVP